MFACRSAGRSVLVSQSRRVVHAGAAVLLAAAVATCGGDSPTAVANVVVFAAQPGNAVAGAAIPAVRIEVRNSSGDIATSFEENVTVAIATGTGTAGATLSGTATVTAVNGVATFSNLSINRSGTAYRLTASTATLASATSNTFDIAAGPMSQLTFTVAPGTAIAGQAMTPAVQVTARDALGNTATGFAGTVTMAIGTNPAAGTLSGTTSVAAVNGVATFSTLSINRSAAGYTLTASTAGPPVANVTSAAFTVSAGPPTQLVFTGQPSNATAGAAFTPAIAVTAQDAQGNVAAGFTGSVTLAIGTNPGGGTLGGTTTVGAVSGVATFSTVSVNRTGAGYTLTASATSVAGATSASFDIAPGAAAELAFTVQPSPVTAGSSITPAIQVSARDAAGNVVPSFTSAVTITIANNAGGGTLSGTVTAAAVGGVASFADLSINKSGIGYTLSAAGGGLTAATSAAFAVVAGPATQLVFSVQPTSAVAGVAITPAVQVTARDALDNVAAGFTGNVAVAIANNPASGTLSGTASAAAVAGVATFANLRIDRAGVGYTLSATSGSLPGATSAGFNIASGPPASLVFSAQPTSATAGAAIAPAVEVTARDDQGNVATAFSGDVTVAIESNPGGGTLSGTVTMAAASGVATFSALSINRSGSGYTLRATTSGVPAVISGSFDIAVGPVARVAFTTEPTSATAGATISPAVRVAAQDALGNTDPAFAGNVTLAIVNNAGGGTLSGTATVAAVAGVATFANLSIDKSGVGYRLGASSGALSAATSAAFNIAAGAATQLVFTVPPSTAAAGIAISPAVTVTARDAFGNTDPTFAGGVTVAIGANPGSGSLSGTATVAASAGVATFADLSINKVGAGYTLTAASGTLTSATSPAFNILPGPPASIEFSVQPTSATAGAAITPAVQVTARDALGNVAGDFTGAVTLAIGNNVGGGTLSGTATRAAVAGIATFPGISIDKVGIGYTLGATSTGVPGVTSLAFNIAVGATTQLAFTVQPTDAVAGVALNPAVVVAARDAFGNLATGFNGNVTIAIGNNAGGSTLSGTATVAAVSGVATFGDLSLNKSGAGYTLAATSGTLTGGTSSAFTISAAAATQLAFVAQPSTAVAGAAIAPAVQVAARDPFDNLDPTFSGNVTVAIANNAGGGALSGTLSAGASAGVATFSDLSIDKTGTGYTLGATSGSLTAATSAGFTISPAPAATIEFSVGPSSAVAGAAITPAVQVTARDALGNVATGFTGNVTIAIANNPAGSTLSGTASLAAVAGVATFANLSLDKAGAGYTLSATAGALPAATSAAFSITPGAPAKLAFTVQPSSAVAGAVIAPPVQVTAQDAFGNTVPTFTGNVVVAIGTNPGVPAGILSGTLTRAAVAGVATFDNLSINRSGIGYTLGATSGTLTAATSTAFNISAGAATALAFTTQPVNTVAGASISPAVQVAARDALGNVDPTFTGNIAVAIGTNPGSGTLSGTATAAAVGGVATFANLSIDKAGTGYTLGATSGALTAATSSAFNITAGTIARVAFSVQPTTRTAGQTITPAVQVQGQDALGNLVSTFTGNVTVAITAGTGKAGATLSGLLTRAAVAGVATFNNLSIDSAATGYTLTATSGALTAGVSSAFDITPGTATRLGFSVQPVTSAAGVAIAPAVVVTARDALGNVVSSFTGSVTVAIGTNPGVPPGVLSGTLTRTAVAGVGATFNNLSINRTGTGYTLTAAATGLTGATSAAFNITPGAPAALFFTVQPSTETVNSVITPAIEVTARDALGNVATQFASNVTLAIGTNPGGGTLNGSVNRAAVDGVATFSNVSITAAGTGYTLTASATGLTGATSTAFNINPPVAVALVFSAQPTLTAAGQTIATVQVSARDASGTLVPTFTNPVSVAITPGTGASGAILSGTLTQAAAGGIASFGDLSLDKAATYKLTATAAGLTDGVSAFFTITPGAATQLVFTVPPSNANAGVAIVPQIQVTARDGLDNVVTGFASPISLAITPGTGTVGAVLSGGGGVVPVNGVASFPAVSINLAGAGYSLDASAAGLAGATSGTFQITAATGNHLQYFVQPTNAVAGASINPAVVVRMLNASNAVDATFTGPVTLAIQAGTGSSGAVLLGTTTVNAIAGVATFSNVSVNRSGVNYRLSATASNAAGAQSGQFNIVAGAAAQLDFLIQPVTTTAGQTMPTFTVRALDALGNVNTTFTGNVTVAFSTNPGNGTLTGTATVAAVGGVATFSTLSIDKSGTGYRFQATSGALTPDISNAFSILGGAPVRFAFTVQPTNTAAGGNITPIVRVAGFDALDNVATFSNQVSLQITSGTGTAGAVLTNGGPVVPVNGVASFPNMSINLTGTGYTLTTSAPTLPAVPAVVSTAFNITP